MVIVGSSVSYSQSYDSMTEVTTGALRKPWTGDLDAIIERRIIRALVVYNKTNYFLDGPTERGITYEALKNFEKFLNGKLKTRHLKVHVVFIPVTRDQLLPYLAKGLGDIAAASLTITPERKKTVDFADPFYAKVSELVVTSKSAPKISSIEDLSGKSVYVRKSSSYYESLAALNKRLEKSGKAKVEIQFANENLETEDILEMVNADMFQITLADNYLAEFWAQIFKDVKVHKNIAVRTKGRIAWAIRKNSPKLEAIIGDYVKTTKKGSLMGNILFKRYLKNTKWVRGSLNKDSISRFKGATELLKKYAAKYEFDWLMIGALAYQESRLNQKTVSSAGAIGVMQLLLSTASSNPINIQDIHIMEKNIHAGTKYLRFIYNRYFDKPEIEPLDRLLLTFASYNAGPAKIWRLRKQAKAMGLNPNKWFRNVEVVAAKVIGRETVQYVSNIFKYYIAYKQFTKQGKLS